MVIGIHKQISLLYDEMIYIPPMYSYQNDK